MAAEPKSELHLEIAHVLFIDVVGYSKLLINDQSEILAQLNQVVRKTPHFREAEGAGKLIRLPTGDGMALVFLNNAEAPVECALEVSKALQDIPHIQLRMGVHSGPINPVSDVNDRANVTGAGINMAQRVMDCGDAGHILLSRRIADDLAQYRQWQACLHDLGECEVKHGVRVGIVNLYRDDVGNPQVPKKLQVLKKHRIRARWITIATGLLLLIGILVGVIIFSKKAPKSTSSIVPEKSVAVLPFENLSSDKENAYFADGMQDEILTDLAKIADLRVISRTSVLIYKAGSHRNLREIAEQLGVANVLEGSVQRASGKVRVNAQLIDARNDRQLWAEHYDRDVADVFAIQSEIAQRIADQLKAKLSPAETAVIAERPTADLVAYAYYIKAREMDRLTNWEGDEKNLNQEVELLEKAIERDPHFALAYCALAKTHIDLSSVLGEPDNRKHLELAKQAAEAGLRVRPDLGEAHLELARYYFYDGTLAHDFSRASDELAIVRTKLPNNAEALTLEARIGRHENRWDASLANLQKASELDPHNGDIALYLGETYFEMRRYSEWEQFLMKRAATSVEPDNLAIQLHLAQIELARGDPPAAQSHLQKIPLDYSPGPWVWSTRFTAALYLRDYEAADRVVAATPAKWADIAFGEQTSSWAEGQVARARGNKQKALAAFAAARKKMEAQLANLTEDAAYLSEVAILDAGLGRKEEAIRQAKRATDLVPISKDSLNGPELITNLALVYTWTGERDRALEHLGIVASIPNGPTYGDLLLNPCWDDLRGDARFEKIVQSLAPKDKR